MPSRRDAAEARAAAGVERSSEPLQLDGRARDLIAALQRERDGYVVRGLVDRVDQVDEQIRIAGGL